MKAKCKRGQGEGGAMSPAVRGVMISHIPENTRGPAGASKERKGSRTGRKGNTFWERLAYEPWE